MPTLRVVLARINAGTKWIVSGAVLGVLLWRRHDATCWALLGSVLAAANCKLWKILLKQSRPAGAPKLDPGMPSSHAQSLGFLSSYAALDLILPFDDSGVRLWQPGVSRSLAAAGILGSAMGFTWLRVTLGFHTSAQVTVGFGLGVASAALWQLLYGSVYLPALAADATGRLRLGLYAATAFAATVFAIKVLRDRHSEKEP
ncbi:LPPE2 [Symbiodinium natans]|uniref:LPPE2 protein n=1 Tax=Symbiodinium natans TaxID=878477 RepID=A0A812J868_9DINO|nr:LPPE2 [Symbiodinium natans]